MDRKAYVKKLLVFVLLSLGSTAHSIIDTCVPSPECTVGGPTVYSPFGFSIGIFCPNEQGGIVQQGQCNYTYNNQVPKKIDDQSDQPANQCGSIINVDSLSVGESVPVIGTNEVLTYFSDRVLGKTADYTFTLPLMRSPMDEGVQNIHVKVSLLGRVNEYDYTPQEDLDFNFNWDGKDANGQLVDGATNINVEISQSYNTPQSDIPLKYSITLGAWKAKLVGLGGWTLSSHHFYDHLAKKIYLGHGTIRKAEGLPINFIDGNISTDSIQNSFSGFMIAAADGSEVYIFNNNGKHLETRSAFSGAILKNFQYDSVGRIVSITDSFGNVTSITRSAARAVIRSPRGQVTRVYFDSNGYASQIMDSQGRSYFITYVDSGGLLKTFQKPSGTISTMSYNNSGQLIRDENSFGSYLTFLNEIMNNGSRRITMGTAENRTTVYNISGASNNGFYRTESKPNGAISTLFYSPASSSVIETDGGSTIEQSFQSDQRFATSMPRTNAISVTSGTQSSQTSSAIVTSASNENILNLITENIYRTVDGKVWQSRYDGTLKKWTFISPLSRQETASYNNFDQLIETRRGSEDPVTYFYDPAGKLNSITQNMRTTELVYNSLDQIHQYKNANGEVNQFTYDRSGRVIRQTLADGRVLAYSYDLNGNLSGIKPSGKPWHYFVYNPLDLLAEYIAPLIDVENKISYEYNLDKQLKKITRPDGTIVIFNYGAATGLLDSIGTAEGTYVRQYNTKGMPTSVLVPQGPQTNIVYDGELIASFTNNFSNIYARVTYAYQNFLQIKRTVATTASAPVEFNISYDNDRLPIQVGDLSIQRDSQTGKVIATTLGQVQEQYSYDPVYGELASYNAYFGSNLIFQELYTRDLLGRISAKTVTTTDGTYTDNYVYDVTGRLTEVLKNGTLLRTYKYDSNSNRLYVEENGRRIRGTYDVQDRLLTYRSRKYSYTAAGDRSVRYFDSNPRRMEYTYNSLGALEKAVRTVYKGTTQVTTVDTFDYLNDGLGRRLEKKKNGALLERFMYDENGRVIAELNAAGRVVSYFVYATRAHTPDYMLRGKVKYKILHDHLGSIRFVVNSTTGEVFSKIEYDEFGKVQPAPLRISFQPFGYAGGLYDPTLRIVRFGARDYDPETGRWMSKDPILFEGGDSNLYGYVLQDPVNLIDPEGKFATAVARGIGAIAAGIIVHDMYRARYGGGPLICQPAIDRINKYFPDLFKLPDFNKFEK